MTIIEELAQAKTDLATKTAALATAEEKTKADAALIAQANKERDDLKAAQIAADAKHAEDVKKINDGMLVEQAAHVATKAQLETAQKALANPAFAAAAAKGDKTAVAEGGTGTDNVVMTFDQANAAYKKITDPKAREQFRTDHAVELRLK